MERMATHSYSDGDILVIVENISFRLHKNMLSLASDVFSDMINCGVPSREEKIPILEIEQENAHDFDNLLSFIYPRKHVSITWNNIERLLRVSDKFMVESATKACEKFLTNNYRRNPLLTFILADKFNFDNLYRESSKLILDDYQNFKSQPSFEMLSERAKAALNERYIKFFFGLCSIAKGVVLDDYNHKCKSTRHYETLEAEWENHVGNLTLPPPSPSTICDMTCFYIGGTYNKKCNDHFTNKYLPEKINDLLGDFEPLEDTGRNKRNQDYYIYVEK
ncbi:BTB/POZ domain-containing protein [Glomus cerebriforme]|uniref:BTB/POZ domain-containing protein n=1 Tax=Glomus cerebriforme TaxID=658196 RepID=A0A397SJL4_9GLOM|nr:BTB/POZ domain-containing protein [Glomus cerebriforme]